MGQGDAAVSMLRQALDADPDLLEAHRHLAYAYASLGRMREADAAIAETSRRFPGEGEGCGRPSRSSLLMHAEGQPHRTADRSRRAYL
jgi:tetratricopeptide (TPR) repeat protein